MSRNRHEGRSVVVTGGASGIGRGVALRFAAEGADVAVADVRRDPKSGQLYQTDVARPTDEVVAADHGGESLFVETDVSDPGAVSAMVEEVVETFGGIDVLVNNAGIILPGDSQETSPEDWEAVLGVDLDGTFYAAKYAIPHLTAAKGALVNVGSVYSAEGGAGPAYTSAKGAVQNLTRDLAVELGDHEVNVNCICPGFIETALQDHQTEESLRTELEHTLLPYAGTPEDIGNAAVFLASDEARFVHGESLFVDGGWSAHSV